MDQLRLFAETGQSIGLPKHLLDYRPGLFDQQQSDYLLDRFIEETPWQQRIQKLYHKEVITPRLTAWYGDPEVYDYASLTQTKPNLWTPEILLIKAKVEELANIQFNSVLLNYYRDGNDSVAWHSDRESVLGKNPIIASVSFGQVRSFDIRNKEDHQTKYSVRLEHGSYLLMKAGLQQYWEHRIAKSIKPMKPRVNLTFRVVI
jgi:alkylated DNA repair dioxygenase AlkB